jgi:pilus assembly protein CpaF
MVPVAMSLGKLLADLDSNTETNVGPQQERRAPLSKVGSVETGRFLDNLGDRVRIKLVDQVGSATSEADLTQEELRRLVGEELERLIREENLPLNDVEQRQMVTSVTNDILGYGPIEPLLEDDSVSEVMVNGTDAIFIEREGQIVLTDIRFRTESHLRQVISRIVTSVGRRIDESSPMVDARLPDGSRVNAIVQPLAVDGPSLTIRKFMRTGLSATDLIDRRSITPEAIAFLQGAVRGKLNILVSGGTGTGKTTFLNMLSGFIPDDERIVTIEDAVELKLRQRNLIRLECRPPNLEGAGEVTSRDLLRNSLRMRPDRIVIGECRGAEALDMLQAMNTGHDGSLTTLHANAPREATSRLETMVMFAGYDLPARAIREQMAAAIDVIIQLERVTGGRRMVTSITEVTGLEADQISLDELFAFEPGSKSGSESLRPTGVRPRKLEKMAKHGVHVEAGIFDPMGGGAGL